MREIVETRSPIRERIFWLRIVGESCYSISQLGHTFKNLTIASRLALHTVNQSWGPANMRLVRIDAIQITNWDAFHDVFAEAFGFPDFYGRNLDAWIDCMACVDDRESGMSTLEVSWNDVVVLHVDNIDRLPDEIYDALVECAAFVNWRRIENGDEAILALSFYRCSS